MASPPGRAPACLAEAVSYGVLTEWFPVDLVDAVIEEAGVLERRRRTLPARLMVYYLLALALFGEGYVEAMSRFIDGMSWLTEGRWTVEPATIPAIARARARLGEAPMALLFSRVAGPAAADGEAPAFWRELRVVSVDEIIVDMPDTPENAACFGDTGADGTRRRPRARLVALGEAGTGALLGAVFGPAASPGALLASPLLWKLDKSTVLVADQAFPAGPLWPDAAASGAELIWRVAAPATPPSAAEVLADGTCLVRLAEVAELPATAAASDFADRRNERARLIECEVTAPGGRPTSEAFALLTTLTDPAEAPAAEILAVYLSRWRSSKIASSLQTQQQERIALRSRHPDTVRQEMWTTLCVYQRLRALMRDANRTLRMQERWTPTPPEARLRP